MMWLRFTSMLVGASTFSSALGACIGPIVDLGYARYRGVRLEAEVDQYLGMRFAEPPLGDLRFRAPREPLPERGTQNADKFRSICAGIDQTPSASLDVSEDCLFVNIFTPSAASSKSKLPVWLYIQGGGFETNTDNNINGTEIIKQSGHNIIFVNFNYRVGAFGFLTGSEVKADGDLNVGLLDQRKVMKWVKKNIAKFGGDPNHIVLHGTSAGASSVAYHLTANGGRDDRLFAGAMAQANFWARRSTIPEREDQFAGVVKAAGCEGTAEALKCLRAADTKVLMAANREHYFNPSDSVPPEAKRQLWRPVIDGTLVLDDLYTQFSLGKFVRVPMLITSSTDEASAIARDASTPEEFALGITPMFTKLTSTDIDKITAAYPLLPPRASHGPWFPSLSAALTDVTFVCPADGMAEAVARHLSPSSVWRYRFNLQEPMFIGMGLGTIHNADAPAIFGPDSVSDGGVLSPSLRTTNAQLVPIVMNYFISFTRSLDPNTHKASTAPTWEPFGNGNGQRLRVETDNTAMEPVPQQHADQCALWRELSPRTEV